MSNLQLPRNESRLHTDDLVERYGPIHARVIRHENGIREAELIDDHETLRTYALTFLSYDPANLEMAAIDKEIKSGNLIGQTFRKHGYVIKRNLIDIFPVPLSAELQKRFSISATSLPARLIEFVVKKENMPIALYGTICEIDTTPDGTIAAFTRPSVAELRARGVDDDALWKMIDSKDADISASVSPETVLLEKKIAEYLGTDPASRKDIP